MSIAEIKAVISELNRIEVKGEDNLDILLGCIKFLKHKVKEFCPEVSNMPKPITDSTPAEVSDNG